MFLRLFLCDKLFWLVLRTTLCLCVHMTVVYVGQTWFTWRVAVLAMMHGQIYGRSPSCSLQRLPMKMVWCFLCVLK